MGGFYYLEGVLVDHETYIEKAAEIICCTLEGELDIDKAISLSRNLREKAVKLGYSVLYDACKLKEPKSAMPVHDFTVKLSSILDATVHRTVRVAFIYQPGGYDGYWQFYENAAAERGLKVKIFTGREEAVKWLSHSLLK